ncbi:MAG: PDZ domain-containing protein, partial [Nitrospirae bacterium]|nr:PDZ domain-containing protein [Nitrospirota bacterium]
KGGDRYVEIGNLILLIGGDIVTAVHGQATDTAEQVISILRERKPGDTVQLSVVRGRKRIAVPLTLEERPRP